MKTILMTLGLTIGLCTNVMAAEKQPTTQQNKMATCNKEAKEKDLAGEDRKKFMSECLKGDKGDQGAKTEESKDGALPPKAAMTACNKAVGEKSLKGDERKKFMSECLTAKGPARMAK